MKWSLKDLLAVGTVLVTVGATCGMTRYQLMAQQSRIDASQAKIDDVATKQQHDHTAIAEIAVDVKWIRETLAKSDRQAADRSVR